MIPAPPWIQKLPDPSPTDPVPSPQVLALLVPKVFGVLARLQRQRVQGRPSGRARDFTDRKGIGDFSEGAFKHFFRFRPRQFFEFMFHLGLAYAGPNNDVHFTEVEFGERWARGRGGNVYRRIAVQIVCGGRSHWSAGPSSGRWIS